MTDYSNWKILKTELDEKQKEYTEVANWCNESQQYHIEDMDEYYAVVKNAEPTEQKLAEQEIWQLKQQLNNTDYIVIKIAEGEATESDYSDVLANRKVWRARINELEAILDK